MKSIISFISSARFMAILLFVFAISIATATFIEKNAGTEAAQGIIYHAKWFEFLFLLVIINIISITVKHKLYLKEKLTVLIFHFSFVVIIIGAAFTRYFGKEGIMPIREGQTTNQWYSSQNYISIQLSEKGNTKTYNYPVLLSPITVNNFRHNNLFNGHKLKFKIKKYIPQTEKVLMPGPEATLLTSAIILEVTCDGISKPLTIRESEDTVNMPVNLEFNGLQIMVKYGTMAENLPFSLALNDFILKRYPGSESPSWFESNVQLMDSKRKINDTQRIYMNHILKYMGYRFYQSSYDMDEKGTLLSVSHDRLGTSVTYAGYILLALGIFMNLLNKKSRFRTLLKKPSAINTFIVIILGLCFMCSSSFAQDGTDGYKNKLPVIDKNHAQEFGKMLVQDNRGRIIPLNTLSSEVLRKVARKESYKGQTSDQVLLGMFVNPGNWQYEPIIRVTNSRIQEIMGIHSEYASFADFFPHDRNSSYILKTYVDEAYRKKPVNRKKFDNEVIRTDERLNICYLVFTQEVLKVFPNPNNSTHKWYSPVTVPGIFNSEDSVFTNHILSYYFEEVSHSMKSGDWKTPEEILNTIHQFQVKYDASIIPSAFNIKTEIFYNQLNIFNRLIKFYLLVGFLLLLIQFIHLFIPGFKIHYYSKASLLVISVAFILHTFGLALRWYISGHAPLSNGYEALSFIAWATILAGLIFSYKSSVTISTTLILSGLILQIAHLSWMDPQITNLVPVLKSYWLVIHVSVVTASYGFLGMGTLLAVINLLLMFFETKKNYERFETQIKQITQIIELTLITGLYLLAAGSFLGGVWANESWGRYWGWDPKETWALVTVIVYAFIVHMRIVPGLEGRLLFNILSLFGFSSVIMTYFGVNYYLSGLHSYATGDPQPLPPVVIYSLIIGIILIVIASINQYYLKKEMILTDNL
jgi:cytochrome c-type biogenesis protein CcsB